jgi:CRISPR-associated protein (TIGR02584 family)
MEERRNILVAVCGLTPQIITEALFCLTVKEKIPVHSVYILTTSVGRNVIFGKKKIGEQVLPPLKDEIKNLCTAYKVEIPEFENNEQYIIVAKEQSVELADVRSDKHNKLFPNKVCGFIREISADPNTVLYCVISGGRKSMSVHLSLALTLFGREKDRLLHVLTSEEHEFKGFYPKNKVEAKVLEIADIPYVRLRPFISTDKEGMKILAKQYSDIVSLTQKRLKTFTGETVLILDIEKRELRYGGRKISLEPFEMVLYCYFAERATTKQGAMIIHDIISSQTAVALRQLIIENYPHHYFDEKKKDAWYNKGISPEYFRSKRSKINLKLKDLFGDPDILNLFSIQSEPKYGDTTYCINAPKRFIRISYPS